MLLPRAPDLLRVLWTIRRLPARHRSRAWLLLGYVVVTHCLTRDILGTHFSYPAEANGPGRFTFERPAPAYVSVGTIQEVEPLSCQIDRLRVGEKRAGEDRGER